MKYFLRTATLLLFFCCTSANIFSQTGAAIDKYLGTTAQLTVIGAAGDNLSVPQDLNFSPVPSRKNELWVVNYGDYSLGGYMVIFYNAGKPNQWSEKRHDSHSQHFMIYPTAFAMGSPDSGYFATTGEALNNVGDPTSTFMGPVLWDSDTTKFARINQNDWVNGLPLGSHLDMLHQSPYSMGIAFDTLNSYWNFDGYHGCLFHYDFQKSHGYGGDDHSDGKLLKYKEVKLKRIPNLPSHMIVDKSTGWLYIVDNGNNRIVRVDTRSGHLGSNLTAPNENPAQYAEMIGVKWQTVDSGFTNLAGIDYSDGRLIVGNFDNGDIRVYNTKSAPKPSYIGTIKTSDPGMVGLRIGPDSNIWYVNRTNNQVVKLIPGIRPKPGIMALTSPTNGATNVAIKPVLTWESLNVNKTSYQLQISAMQDFSTTILDNSSLTTSSFSIVNPFAVKTTYFWRVRGLNESVTGDWSDIWSFTTLDPASIQNNNVAVSKLTINEIYPNPSSVSSTVAFTTTEQLRLHISIVDLLGREVSVIANENYSAGSHALSVNLSTLSSGTYFYQFTYPQGMLLKPFAVSK